MRVSCALASSVLASMVVVGLAVPPALCAEQSAFSAAALKAAQDAGKPIVVDIAASWCTTCAAQKPIVQELLKEPKFKTMVLLHLDYDKQKPAMAKLGVQQRSTFVAYKGKQEVGRSTGDTNKTSIEALFDKTS